MQKKKSSERAWLKVLEYTEVVNVIKFIPFKNSNMFTLRSFPCTLSITNIEYTGKLICLQTRACRQISFPVSRPNLKVYENSPYYIGSELWSILPAHIQEITDKKLFDCLIREWLRKELAVD